MTMSLWLLVKATIILIAAFGLDAWLRRRHVLTCAAMWNAVVVALLALPIAALVLPKLPLPLLRSSLTAGAMPAPVEREQSIEISRVIHDELEPAPESTEGQLAVPATGEIPAPSEARAQSSQGPSRNWFTLGWILAAVYTAGVIGCLIRLIAALLATARLQSTGVVVDCADWQERLARWRARLGCSHVKLRQAAQVQVPLMVGLVRPTILLPHSMVMQLEARSRDAVLVHELAHVLRGDFGWQLALRIVQALLWFHPLIWLAERRIHFIRERACDDFTVHSLGSGEEYAETLLAIAGRLAGRPVFGLGLAVLRTPQITARIEALASSDGNARCRLSLGGRLLTLCGCVLIAGLLGSVAIVQARQPDQAPKAKAAQPAEKSAKAESRQNSAPNAPSDPTERTTPLTVTGTTLGDEPQAAETPGTVSGEVVLTEGGGPVAGAMVLLRDGRLRRTTTDDMGRFRFNEISPGHYQLWAVKENLVSPKQQIIGQDSNADAKKPRFSPVRLPMSTGKQIKVTATSAATGQPIAGANVELGYPDRQGKVTAQDGTAVLQALLPDRYSMTIQAAGYARVLREIDLKNADNLTFQAASLAPGGTMRGTVTDENDKPLAQANIVFRCPESPIGFYGESPYADAQGEYRSLYLPLNTPLRISVSLKDYLSQQQEVTLTDQQRDLQLNFQLRKRPLGGSVSGIVTDVDGKPIAGATVANFGDAADEKRETKTDPMGQFSLQDVVKGYAGHELIVRVAGFVTARQRFEPSVAETSAAIAIKLEKGHSIRAQVQDTAGQPIPGVYIDVNGGSFRSQAGESLRTDRDGRFSSNSLPLNSTFHLYAAGHSSLDKIQLALDGEETVVVTLEPTGVVRGRVVDAATGKAITQFRVRIGFAADVRPGDVRGTYDSELGDPGLTFQADDGAFTINELTSRMPFRVIVEAEGYEPAAFPRVVAQPATLAEAAGVSLKKREPLKLASLSGQVVDHQGSPVSGVQLRLVASAEPSNGDNDNRFNWALIDSGQLGQKDYVEQYLSAVTDGEGKFELKELLPGKFLQLVYWGKNAPKGRTLALAKTKESISQSVTVQLPEPATIRGSFDAKEFPNASRVSLTLQGQSFHHYECILPGGKTDFAFDNLPPGKYWLSVVGQPERNQENSQLFSLRPLAARTLLVQPGKTMEVHISKEDQVQGAKR